MASSMVSAVWSEAASCSLRRLVTGAGGTLLPRRGTATAKYDPGGTVTV